jgi:hypothetical protein
MKIISLRALQKHSFEQWPPPESTSTGGWLETNWSQSVPGNVQLEVKNIRGRLVQEIYSGPMDKGVHCIVWQADAINGIYYITMSSRETWQTEKIIIK